MPTEPLSHLALASRAASITWRMIYEAVPGPIYIPPRLIGNGGAASWSHKKGHGVKSKINPLILFHDIQSDNTIPAHRDHAGGRQELLATPEKISFSGLSFRPRSGSERD